MFINTKCSCEFANGTDVVKFPNAYLGDAPEWLSKHPYFLSLVKDGSIIMVNKEEEKNKGKKQ